MKEFKDTGLPQDPLVYRAYMTYAKNIEPGPAAEHGLRMAQVLQKSFGDDAELLSLALLSTLPRESLGAMQQLFGRDKADVLFETNRHARTGFAYVQEASPVVQTLATASAIASIDDFTAHLAKMYTELSIIDATKSKHYAMVPPPFPNVKLCNQVIKAAFGKTGSDAMDWELIEKLQDYEMTVDERLIGLPFTAPEVPDYKGFAASGLMQDDKVQAAYYALTNHSQAETADVSRALIAAKVLSDTPGMSPTAVAFSLIDMGLRRRGTDDLAFLEKDLDWDVILLLENHALANVSKPADIFTAPLEFRQAALAGAIATIDMQLQHSAEIYQNIADGDYTDEIAAIFKVNEARQLNRLLEVADKTTAPVAYNVEAPKLTTLFQEKRAALAAFIDTHCEKPMLALPAPTPPPKAKPESGQNFDL